MRGVCGAAAQHTFFSKQYLRARAPEFPDKKGGMIGGEDEWIAADDGLNGGVFFELLFKELTHGAAVPAFGVLEVAVERQISWIKSTQH